MGSVTEFDCHDTIAYRDTSKLFWKTFAYKVVVAVPPYPHIDYWDRSEATQKKRDDATTARKKFLRDVLITCPLPDDKRWRYINNGNTLSVFFVEGSDAVEFINKNHKIISTVFRPFCQEQVDAMASDHRCIVRESLFWEKYRFAVTFRRLAVEHENEVDSWVADYYADDEDRAKYVFSHQRIAYFNDFHDVLFTRLALGEYVSKIEKIILKSEISGASGFGS